MCMVSKAPEVILGEALDRMGFAEDMYRIMYRTTGMKARAL